MHVICLDTNPLGVLSQFAGGWQSSSAVIDDTHEQELKSLLEPYGTVVSWRFLLSGERHRRGPALAR